MLGVFGLLPHTAKPSFHKLVSYRSNKLMATPQAMLGQKTESMTCQL
jgi:hypothetical protein